VGNSVRSRRAVSGAGEPLRLARRLASIVPGKSQPLGEPPRVLAVISSPDNLESLHVQTTGAAGLQAHSFAPLEAPFLPQQTLGVAALFDGLKAKGLIATIGS